MFGCDVSYCVACSYCTPVLTVLIKTLFATGHNLGVKHKGVLIFNPHNVLETVKGVEDWWSEGGHYGRRGGLGYWLAVSEQKRKEIQEEYGDPDEQKMKLIECWMGHVFASWQWLSRAVGRVGQTELASLISSYSHPHKQMNHTCKSISVIKMFYVEFLYVS